MTAHQAAGVHLGTGLLARLRQCPEEVLSVTVTLEDILPPIASAHDVVDRSGKLNSQLARHARESAKPVKSVKTIVSPLL